MQELEKDASAFLASQFRGGVMEIEKALLDSGGAMGDEAYALPGCGLFHHFGDGLYIRECHLGAGTLLTSKIHKTTHPAFVLKGKCRVLTEKGIEDIVAPYYTLTTPATKRLIYVLEDTVWITVHATESQDLEVIEKEVIAKDFAEFNEEQIASLMHSIEEELS